MMTKKLSSIPGFETCTNYTIYSDGRIFSEKKGDFIQASEDSKGYLYLDIRYRKAILKCPKVHKLVMLAFSKKSPKEHINHIDGNKKNNNITNLEYVTNRENREHAINLGLKNEIRYGIAQYSLNGCYLNTFDTAKDALEYLGLSSTSSGNIGRVITGKRKTAYGYIWKQCEGSTTIESTPQK